MPHPLELEPIPAADAAVPGADAAALPLEEGAAPAEAQDEDKEPETPGPKCGDAIDWQPKSPVPVDITADSVSEFVAKMDAALGSPHMQAEMSWDLEATGGKVTKCNFVLETTIIRARYAGGRASDKEKALIRRVVNFVKAHEERHRDLSHAVFQQAVCDALGQSLTAADRTLEKARCEKEPTAQKSLDGKEGKLEWIKDASGAVVDFKAVGVEANYKPDNCK